MQQGRLPLPCLLPLADVPPAKLPRPAPLAGPYAPNTALRRATRLFEGSVQGSESVAVAGDGSLLMLDKFGRLLRAAPSSSSSPSSSGGGSAGYRLESEPLALLGPGRPLGFHLSADGASLIICDSLKVALKGAGGDEQQALRRGQGPSFPAEVLGVCEGGRLLAWCRTREGA